MKLTLFSTQAVQRSALTAGLFLLVLALSALGPVRPVGAAAAGPGPLVLDTLDLSVEPEYDSSDVLVVYEASFVNNGTQPYDGDILFHVPKGVSPAGPTNEVHICQVEGTNRHAYCAPYRIDQSDDYLTFTWKARQPIPVNGKYPIYIEYYYNPLKISGTSREMSFAYHPSYPVSSLNLTVLEPLRTSDFRLDPPALQSGKATGGFNHFIYPQKNLQPESTFVVKASYVKADNRPSIPRQVSGGGQGSAGTKQGSSKGQLFGLLGIVAALFGGVFFLANRDSGRRGGRPKVKGQAPVARPHSTARHRPGTALSAAQGHVPPPHQSAPATTDRTQQKEMARRLLLAGKISEATYRDIVRDLDEEAR